MIIFTDKPELISLIDKPYVFNLSSFYSGYDNITNLCTSLNWFSVPQGMQINEYIYSPDFDMQYSSLVFNRNDLFISLMKLLLHSFEGDNVVVLVNRDLYRDAIMESLIKIIQIRYGYNCWVIEDTDDIPSLKESSFTPNGIMLLDEDRKRYTQMVLNGMAEHIIDPNINKE